MPLAKFCRKPVVTISPHQTIMEACRLLKRDNVGCLVVEEDQRLCGILTDRDIVLKVTSENRDPTDTKVAAVMTPNPVCASVKNTLHEVTSLMHAFHVRRVPVVNEAHKTLGIITMDDIVALLGTELFDVGKTVARGVSARERARS